MTTNRTSWVGTASAVPTRRAEESRLRELGVEGDALELLLKEGAPARHAARVQAANAAAAATHDCDAEEGEPCVGCLVILVADIIGVGGRSDAEGRGTDRIPPLGVLGKGRKQATDGPAWDAAILAAAISHLFPLIRENAGVVELTPDVVAPLLRPWPRWLRSVALEGLRRSVDHTAWHPVLDTELYGLKLPGAPEDWAALINGQLRPKTRSRRELCAAIMAELGRKLTAADLQAPVQRPDPHVACETGVQEALARVGLGEAREAPVAALLRAAWLPDEAPFVVGAIRRALAAA